MDSEGGMCLGPTPEGATDSLFSQDRQIHRSEVYLHCLGFFSSGILSINVKSDFMHGNAQNSVFCFPPCPDKFKSLETGRVFLLDFWV